MDKNSSTQSSLAGAENLFALNWPASLSSVAQQERNDLEAEGKSESALVSVLLGNRCELSDAPLALGE